MPSPSSGLGLGITSLRKPSLNASQACLHVTTIPREYDRVSCFYRSLPRAANLLPGASFFIPSLANPSSSLASHQPVRCPSRVSPSLTACADTAVVAGDLIREELGKHLLNENPVGRPPLPVHSRRSGTRALICRWGVLT